MSETVKGIQLKVQTTSDALKRISDGMDKKGQEFGFRFGEPYEEDPKRQFHMLIWTVPLTAVEIIEEFHRLCKIEGADKELPSI